MPTVYAVASLKGGVGKSTCAVHLAAALAGKRGARVRLLDADANRSATGWAARGALPFDVLPLDAGAANATAVVIDAAASEAAGDLADLADLADVVIVPAAPHALDLLACVATLRSLPEDAHAVALLTLCPPAPSRAAAEARAWLAEHHVPTLRRDVPRRAAYAHAALTGTLAWDHRGGRDQRDLWRALAREVTP